ncbi:Enterobactin exporter EntS [Frondihabitans sp. 762G35]|uniref:MFS transporter n=1 Tax=Frondihabitans sp. 762G35 TaxID=1446794 RepID=UPI000D202395|nr:Enterobactin exporter EntS [Frondihabitans sp. 762G35]
MTFLLGAASALQLPAYQALVPEIVPRKSITDAAALSSVGVNLARAVGPALAGLVIARLGVPFVFAANALSFALFLIVLLAWRGYQRPDTRVEPFIDATRAGIRYILHAGVVRRVLVQLACVMVPANALWALLPLIAAGPLRLSSSGYGLLLAAVGLGSVGGAFLMPAIRTRLGIGGTVAVASVIFGATSIALVLVPSLPVALAVLIVGGVAWIGVVTTLNGTVQSFLPAWVRSRGLAVYQLVLFGSTAVGSALAGAASSLFGVLPVMVAAGALTAVSAVLLAARPFPSLTGRDRAPMPSTDVPPVTEHDPALQGDVLVLVRWQVAAGHVRAFLTSMDALGHSRRRTGAREWTLHRDRDHPDTWAEVFRVGSWQEHIDQQTVRRTGDDAGIFSAVREHASDDPDIEYLITPDRTETPHV